MNVKSAKAKSKRCFIWYQYKTWYFATKMMDIVNESKKKTKTLEVQNQGGDGGEHGDKTSFLHKHPFITSALCLPR